MKQEEMILDISFSNTFVAWSLRRVLGVMLLKGLLAEPSRLRFDFSHMKPISDEEINKIELFVNSMVSKKSDVRTRPMTPDEAVEMAP